MSHIRYKVNFVVIFKVHYMIVILCWFNHSC